MDGTTVAVACGSMIPGTDSDTVGGNEVLKACKGGNGSTALPPGSDGSSRSPTGGNGIQPACFLADRTCGVGTAPLSESSDGLMRILL